MRQFLYFRQAAKSLSKLTSEIRRDLLHKLETFAETGIGDVRRLVGQPGYRLRSGDCRMVFDVEAGAIRVRAAGHRREIYRQEASVGAQVIVTEAGEELVVFSRREYDALLASLGNEEAEGRAAARIIAESDTAIARGDEILLPTEFVDRMLDGDTPLRAARLHVGLERDRLAMLSGLSESDLAELEAGHRAPTADERDRIASALGVDPRWLDDLRD